MNTKVKKKTGYSKKSSGSSKGNMIPGYSSQSKSNSKFYIFKTLFLNSRILYGKCKIQKFETEN